MCGRIRDCLTACCRKTPTPPVDRPVLVAAASRIDSNSLAVIRHSNEAEAAPGHNRLVSTEVIDMTRALRERGEK